MIHFHKYKLVDYAEQDGKTILFILRCDTCGKYKLVSKSEDKANRFANRYGWKLKELENGK